MKDDHMKNLANTKCSRDTESEHIEHSQQIESERNVALMCEICSKTLNNLYNFNLHKQICKEKQTFICKNCSKKLDNLHNLKSHQEACKGKQTFICKKCSKELDNSHNLKSHQVASKGKQIFICKICSKNLGNLYNLNEHETKRKKKYNETTRTYKCSICSKNLGYSFNLNEHETKCKKKYNETTRTYKCSTCSKVLDNKGNLLQHEKACRKHREAAKAIKKKNNKDHHKSSLSTQLESKYNTNLNEEKIITDKLKQTKSKIADRQYQILKLEKWIHVSKKENNSNGNYLRKQIIDLED